MIEFDENGEVTIVWVGTHQDYETTFKNNKDTIEKWLRSKGYIEWTLKLSGINSSDLFQLNVKLKNVKSSIK